MFEGVHHVAHRLPLNVLEPFDSPTHRPPVQLFDGSNFITSVLPSPLKSPVSTLILVGVHHVAHRLVLNALDTIRQPDPQAASAIL